MSSVAVVLGNFVGDMLAADRYVLEMIQSHVRDETVRSHPEAVTVLGEAELIIGRHVLALEQHLRGMDVRPVAAAAKEVLSTISGKVAGLYGKVRSEKASRMLRDDYLALSLAAASCTMLHTTALAFHENRTAELAVQQLRELAAMVIEISKVLPHVVARELAEEYRGADPAVGAEAEAQTHEAWTADTSRAAT